MGFRSLIFFCRIGEIYEQVYEIFIDFHGFRSLNNEIIIGEDIHDAHGDSARESSTAGRTRLAVKLIAQIDIAAHARKETRERSGGCGTLGFGRGNFLRARLGIFGRRVALRYDDRDNIADLLRLDITVHGRVCACPGKLFCTSAAQWRARYHKHRKSDDYTGISFHLNLLQHRP